MSESLQAPAHAEQLVIKVKHSDYYELKRPIRVLLGTCEGSQTLHGLY